MHLSLELSSDRVHNVCRRRVVPRPSHRIQAFVYSFRVRACKRIDIAKWILRMDITNGYYGRRLRVDITTGYYERILRVGAMNGYYIWILITKIFKEGR